MSTKRKRSKLIFEHEKNQIADLLSDPAGNNSVLITNFASGAFGSVLICYVFLNNPGMGGCIGIGSVVTFEEYLTASKTRRNSVHYVNVSLSERLGQKPDFSRLTSEV